MRLQKPTTINPFMRESVIPAAIAVRAGYHHIGRVICAASAQWYYMIDMIGITDAILAPIALALLPLVLLANVLSRAYSCCLFFYSTPFMLTGFTLRSMILSIVKPVFLISWVSFILTLIGKALVIMSTMARAHALPDLIWIVSTIRSSAYNFSLLIIDIKLSLICMFTGFAFSRQPIFALCIFVEKLKSGRKFFLTFCASLLLSFGWLKYRIALQATGFLALFRALLTFGFQSAFKRTASIEKFSGSRIGVVALSAVSLWYSVHDKGQLLVRLGVFAALPSVFMFSSIIPQRHNTSQLTYYSETTP